MTPPKPGCLPPVAPPRPMGAISPSRFTGMEACALREVWSASRAPGLLPASPAAWVGTAAHRLLEEAGKGAFNGPADERIPVRWHQLIDSAEEAMQRSWLERHLVPLSAAVPDFEVRRLRAVSRARQLADEGVVSKGAVSGWDGTHHGYELAVSTPEGKAAGRIDAVLPGAYGPVIRDYKSGAIHEGLTTTRIKRAYAIQLKLYAAIYQQTTGTWPERLEVMALSGEPEAVAFTPEECARLLEDAIKLLDRVNEIVQSAPDEEAAARRLATPAPSVCGFCPYRPHCGSYTDASLSAPELRWPGDAWGRVAERRTLGNGRELIAVDSPRGPVLLRGLTPGHDRHPTLRWLDVGDQVGIFGMRPGGSALSFTEGQLTVIYVSAVPGPG